MGRVHVESTKQGLETGVAACMEAVGITSLIHPGTRVALKPNLTFPFHKPGVTTSPSFLQATVAILADLGADISIVETDGGYGAWKVSEAFQGHGLDQLADRFGVRLVNLCEEASSPIQFRSRGRLYKLPLPVRLLDDTDVFLTLPVPKIHCMTGLSLAYKNQWGCIPDIMRLRRHYIFDDAIVAINQALRPMVIADGQYFLNDNGPMEGQPVRMDLVLAATDAGSFDRYTSELMGFSWRKIPHLRRAAALGDMPETLDDIEFERMPSEVCDRPFVLHRTLRNWIALAGFKSRAVTWFGYESWFGRVVVHALLYAIVGRPVPIAAPAGDKPTLES